MNNLRKGPGDPLSRPPISHLHAKLSHVLTKLLSDPKSQISSERRTGRMRPMSNEELTKHAIRTSADILELNEKLDDVLRTQHDHSKRFDAVDERFNSIDKRFEQIDKKFEQID